jgi:hypothetical protein
VELTRGQLNVIADLIGARCKLPADKARKIADEIGQALSRGAWKPRRAGVGRICESP